MQTDTKTLAEAMDILARDIQSDDGVAEAAIREAAERLGEAHLDKRRLDYMDQHFRDFRFISHPTMDGKYPAWSYWSPEKGRNDETLRKTLREAIDAAMNEGGVISE